VVPVTADFSGVARSRATAVRLADGRLLSAAHILDDAGIAEGFCRLGRRDPPPRLSAVTIDPATPATRIRNGQARLNRADCELTYRGGADLALLAASGPRGAALCETDTIPGQPVLVATRDRTTMARMGGEVAEENPANGRYALLPMRLEAGESGGGVFDASGRCLHGIVSQRALGDPDAAWIVRTSVIRAFLAGG
jgi:hypothetical protein